nr:hypothetical protein [candidate division Zixibacteria bacterium]
MKRTLIFLAAAVLMLTSAAFAQPGGRGPMAPGQGQGQGYGMKDGMRGGMGMMNDGFGGPGMLLRVADEIGLDDQQKTQIDKLAQENGLARIEKQAELEKAELKMRHLRVNNGSDTEILALMDKIGQLKTDLQKMRYQHHQAVKMVLTEAQLEKLKEMRKEFRRDGWNRDDDDRGRRTGRGQGRGMGMDDEDFDSGFGYGLHDGTGPRADCPLR